MGTTNTLPVAAHFLKRATCPEDVFGELKGNKSEQREQLAALVKMMRIGLHPDLFPDDKAVAEEATKIIAEMEMKAEAAIRRGDYGKNSTKTIIGKYHRYKELAIGDIADLHNAYFQDETGFVEVVLKAVRNKADAIYLQKEKTFLQELHYKFKGQPLDDCIPKVYESFSLSDGRMVNVLESLEGWYDVKTIHSRMLGVDGRTLVWMWKRLLTLLSNVHATGLLHGAVLPPHVLYFPDNEVIDKDLRRHAVRLIDWCYSERRLSGGTRLNIWCPQYKDFYPPEIINKSGAQKVGRRSELYMAAKTMQYLTGGNVTTNKFPDSIPAELGNCIAKCFVTDYASRPATAGFHFDEFNTVANKVYDKKYHDFILPDEDTHDI